MTCIRPSPLFYLIRTPAAISSRAISLCICSRVKEEKRKKKDLDGRFVIETLFSAAATGLINIQIVSIIPSAHRFPDDCRGKILSYHVSQRRIAQQSLQAYQRPPSLCVCVSLQITGDYNPSSFLSISAALLITTRRAPLSVGPDVRRHRLDYLFSWWDAIAHLSGRRRMRHFPASIRRQLFGVGFDLCRRTHLCAPPGRLHPSRRQDRVGAH